jgi:hypothetical protein
LIQINERCDLAASLGILPVVIESWAPSADCRRRDAAIANILEATRQGNG